MHKHDVTILQAAASILREHAGIFGDRDGDGHDLLADLSFNAASDIEYYLAKLDKYAVES